MKILIDACVWSLVFRRRPESTMSAQEHQMVDSLSAAIRDGRAAIIGAIRQEILSGIKEPAQFEKLRRTMQSFSDEPVTSADHEEAGRLFNLCRSRGFQSSPIDILLCAVASRRGWAILTNDLGLQRCMSVIASGGNGPKLAP
jgi:predicted nucleic acid-binding protein